MAILWLKHAIAGREWLHDFSSSDVIWRVAGRVADRAD